ncbi:MAG: thrombospondin type 3 repeat-containing protein [bacterium]
MGDLTEIVEYAPDGDDDGIPDDSDNCRFTANPGQSDTDADGLGDSCDPCTDSDGDEFGDPGFSASICPLDNCPDAPNSVQEDADVDGIGNACDNCKCVTNEDQSDSDGDGAGDACDVSPVPVGQCIEGPNVLVPQEEVICLPGVGQVCL